MSPKPVSEQDFKISIEQALDHAKKENTSHALLLLHISNLSMIVSAYGHHTCESIMDDLLMHIHRILSSEDSVVRLQRDQFALLIHNSYPEDTEKLAYRIINVIQNYGRDHFSTAALHVIAKIGSVHLPEDASTAEQAFDTAYIAVHSGEGRPYISAKQTQEEADNARQQMGLANYLYSAYKEKRLRLAWQPVVHTGNGFIHHHEGLLRLVGPSGKITSAGALIPVAEQMGLIEVIDRMVFDLIVKELELSPNITLAFNVSNLTTENNTWLNHVVTTLDNRPEIASRMIVEITETAAHRDLRRVGYFVATLQSLGCHVSLDDFGSGYTSFRQLKALSVDSVKIDGVFIKDIADNADNRFFVKTLLDFSRGFGLETVAEFVENGEIAKILMDMGVDYLQGYYLGRPENHRSWLDEGEYRAE